jgi:hypothetical protein
MYLVHSIVRVQARMGEGAQEYILVFLILCVSLAACAVLSCRIALFGEDG